MNYLAHGWQHLDNGYVLAGTAVPDWLNVVDRRLRVRQRHAEPWTLAVNPQVASVARGIVRHHRDDAWFHERTAFAELSSTFSHRFRLLLADTEGMRPYFLGHILVEILLDAVLTAEQPARLAAYYEALTAIDPRVVQAAVNCMAVRPTERLAPWLERFLSERFLWDYLDDAKLWVRLNQVLQRVGLPPLPERAAGMFAQARLDVASRRQELLPA